MSDDLFDSNAVRSPKSKIRARCPACNAWVLLRDNIEVWDPVTCPECDSLLEVVDLRPPTLDYAQDDSDDEWEDDWEEEEWSDQGGRKSKRR